MTQDQNARSGVFSALAGELSDVVARLQRSTVIVRDGGRGAGSGIIWQPDGVIVTNAHVVQGRNPEVRLSDGRSFKADVRLSSPHDDLALLDIPARGLPAVTVGDSASLRVGELVFAVGNPLGLPGAVTTGIISAPPPRGSAARGQRAMIHADISLAPGNSGGLLATADGSVVGVNAMVRSPGLALAVPSNTVTALLARGNREDAYLGIAVVQVALPAAWITPETGDTGFLVTSVSSDSPAEEAGLLIGDVIVGSGGDASAAPEAFSDMLADVAPGQALDLLILRGGSPRSLSIVAGRRLDKAA
jgi:serine protease Do